MLFTQRREQPLFSEFAAVQERSAVAAHPLEERLALFQLHALLAELLENVKKNLVPVLDFVADRQVEGFEAGPNQVDLRRAELQHPGDVIKEVPHRSGELRFGRDDLSRQ